HRQEVVTISSINAAPAQMIGEPWRFSASHQRFQFLEMFAIQRLSRAKVHGNAMLDYLVLIQDLIEYVQRTSAVDHVVFRDDFEPTDDRLFLKDVIVVRNAKADSDSEILESVKAIGWH